MIEPKLSIERLRKLREILTFGLRRHENISSPTEALAMAACQFLVMAIDDAIADAKSREHYAGGGGK